MATKTWATLSESEMNQYKEYCDSKYGKTIARCETGEPIYFDEKMNRVNTDIVIDLLFSNSKN